MNAAGAFPPLLNVCCTMGLMFRLPSQVWTAFAQHSVVQCTKAIAGCAPIYELRSVSPFSKSAKAIQNWKEPPMHQIIYIVGAVVVVIAILSFVGLA